MIEYPKNKLFIIILFNVIWLIIAVFSIFLGGFLLVRGALPREEILEFTKNISNLDSAHKLIELQARCQYWYGMAHYIMYSWLVYCLGNLYLAMRIFFAKSELHKPTNEAANAGEMPT